MAAMTPIVERTRHSCATLEGACRYYFNAALIYPVPVHCHPEATRKKVYDKVFFTPETFTTGHGLVAVDYFQKVFFSSHSNNYAWLAKLKSGTWRAANHNERRVLEARYT